MRPSTSCVKGDWFTQDVLDFMRQRPAIQPERGAEQPTIIDQPTATSEQRVGLSPVGTGAG